MASSIYEIGNLVYLQISGGGSDESIITLEEVITTAKLLYATETLNNARLEKQIDGEYTIPSQLLLEAELEVKGKEADISKLNIERSFPNEAWVQGIGGEDCECKYIKSTLNLSKILCDDDSLPDNVRIFYIVGNKVKFPRGTHAKNITLTYINDGTGLDADDVQVSDAIGGVVRVKLLELYLGRTLQQDVTNNSTPNN